MNTYVPTFKNLEGGQYLNERSLLPIRQGLQPAYTHNKDAHRKTSGNLEDWIQEEIEIRKAREE